MGVHLIDFGAVTATGEGYRVVADGAASHPFTIRADLYGPLAVDALRFFTLQRSGTAIDDWVAPGYGRPAGHVGVPPNRGDTAVRSWTGPDAERLYPGWRCAGEFDVSGGWYNAGDHGKYVVNAGLSVAQLLSARERARRSGPRQLCLIDRGRAARRVPMGARLDGPHAGAGRERRWPGMAFHRVHGTEWPPLAGCGPTRTRQERVLHRPSTAATLQPGGRRRPRSTGVRRRRHRVLRSTARCRPRRLAPRIDIRR